MRRANTGLARPVSTGTAGLGVARENLMPSSTLVRVGVQSLLLLGAMQLGRFVERRRAAATESGLVLSPTSTSGWPVKPVANAAASADSSFSPGCGCPQC